MLKLEMKSIRIIVGFQFAYLYNSQLENCGYVLNGLTMERILKKIRTRIIILCSPKTDNVNALFFHSYYIVKK